MKHQILDHGYLELIEHWGSDERVIESARMSTDAGFRGWGNAEKPGDEKLLKYLWENKHSTPFEFAGALIEVQAPIFVFREWFRHRTQSFSELSARYSPMPCLHYVPTIERLMMNSGVTNKQAGTIKDAKPLTIELAESFQIGLRSHYEKEESLYQWGLNSGVPKELARLPVSVARYSRMRASANLRNWLAFLTLRNDKNAQWEIREFAIKLQEILSQLFPRTLYLFEQGQNNG